VLSKRRTVASVLWLACCLVFTEARTAGAQATLLAQADSAFAAHDVATARRLYEAVIRTNPTQSRAVFRLAILEPRADRSLTLLRRYCELEPVDAWGQLALADRLSKMGRSREALVASDSAAALAPQERDVALGRARILQHAGHSARALQVLEEWTSAYSNDAEAWDLLARQQRRVGRPRGAIRSFTRADSLRSVPGVASRLQAAQAAAAPAVEPFGGYQRDSDRNTAQIAGFRGDVMVADGVRLGLVARRGEVGDDTASAMSTGVHAVLDARLAPETRFNLEGGARRFEDAAGVSWTHPEIDARLRVRGAARGPALELRGQHLTLGVGSALVSNQVTRSELRAGLDLPLGALRLRPGGRVGVVNASIPVAPTGLPQPPNGPRAVVPRTAETNTRFGFDAALALPLTPAFEWSAQYHTLAYERASLAGYFAPRFAETLESGIYTEVGTDGPISLAADIGGGVQRIAPHGEAAGGWSAAFRVWSYAAIPFRPGRSLWAEVEAYDAAFAPVSVATSSSWRYIAFTVGLRWSMR
jgi:tetratricopeptide (TPR) repeat protein